MAASSCKYDVFLSFRGEDTRKSFVCHLHKALEQKAIHTFIDSEKLQKGHQISDLLDAVEASSVSIVVLSQNYASSTWCLKELVRILECRDGDKKQIVVPIFYQVDPSDLRKIKGKFAEAFAEHEGNSKLDKDELKSWRGALTRVADLSGWVSRQYKDDIELIENVVGDVLEKWIHIPRPSSLKTNLVGMEHHIKEVSLRLCRGRNDVGVVGIWGMGGVGKTTMARAVYDSIVHQFEHKCFFYDVKEGFAKKGEAQMRGELLSMILNGNVQSVGIFNEGVNVIHERLGNKKVLVVLDDVETYSQIEALLGNFDSFGAGSRVLVTTRDKESIAAVSETYEPRCLNHDESLVLFMKHAFRTNQPSKEYSDLSRRAIAYAQGLPLALEVLGASLYNKSIDQWKEVLEKIKKIPQRKILDVLRTSFEGLDDPEKDIFLDIACCFRGWRKSFVTELLENFGFFPHTGLSILVDRALITISQFGLLNMHDLLQEMGREIVRLESTKEPGKRSRLCSYEDVNRVLTQDTAMDTVECVMLKLSDSKVDLHTEGFVRMKKLRVLIIYYSFHYILDDFDVPYGSKQLTRGDLEFLSHELRILLWHGCPLKSLPSTYIPYNLVNLDMRGSHIQQLWEGIQPLPKLKVILLNGCENLVKIPDLTEAINLQTLSLHKCSSLSEVHSSVFALQNLEVLDLGKCKELKILSSSMHMKSLKSLYLNGCSNLEKFPEISGIMKELRVLSLDETAIKRLPSSINLLVGITYLTMNDCKSLEFLPVSICNLGELIHLDLSGCSELKTILTSIHMSSLWILDLDGCSNLEKFPEISGIMKDLQQLYLDGTAIKRLPSSINLLVGLNQLSMRNCKSLEFLPDSICNLAELIHLSDCNLLELSDGIAHLSSMQTLKLCRNNLESLPAAMNRLDRLTRLEVEACRRLKSIPELSSSINCIDAHECIALETVSKPKPRYQTSYFFTFSNCFRLVETKLFIDILERHSHFQDNCIRALQLNMSLPGSVVPDWFDHQSEGSSVSVQLPPNSLDHKVSGFAICAVLKNHHYLVQPSSITCLCTCKGNHGEQSISFDLLNSDRMFLRSDHTFLGYVSWCLIEEGKLVNETYSEVTFQIVAVSTSETEQLHITSCGIRFAYANQDEILNLHMPQSKVHVDYGETGVFFMDPYELRNRKNKRVEKSREIESSSYGLRLFQDNDMEVENESITQPTIHVEEPFFPSQLRKAESLETGEGSGEYQTLELLPEIQTEIKEEEEIMVVAQHGEGCQVLGSVCCCLTLSGCIVSLRKREAEREGDRVTRVANDEEISEVGSNCCLVDPNLQSGGKEEKKLMAGEPLAGEELLGSVCCCLSLSGCSVSLKKSEAERGDRVTNDGEISELGNHGSLVVPNSRSEVKEEKRLMGEDRRELLGSLCSCFDWLGTLWR